MKSGRTEPYKSFPNAFRQQLLKRDRVLGCWLSLGSPVTTEVVGIAGFDWVLLDAEHAINDVLSLYPQLLALKDSVSAPVVRPPWNDTVIIKRLLDAGFSNFLIPFVESAEQAGRAVAATRYPPEGVRGVSVSQRGNRYGSVHDYFGSVNQQISVTVQIENRAAVDSAAEIAAVDGVDCLFIGPADLAAAYGHLGNPGHPDVQAAISKVQQSAEQAGKATGILAPVEVDARRYMEAGFSMVAVGSDLALLRQHTQALADLYEV